MAGIELRDLPSVDKLLQHSQLAGQIDRHGRELTLAAIRATLQSVRQSIMDGAPIEATFDDMVADVVARLQSELEPSLTPVINATGVIVHTNLGRAPLSQRAQQAISDVAIGYSSLEYDLQAGSRGSRYQHAADLLARLTGAEDALVVNNNAAAVLLALTALAKDREVLISRSQLVEIGGGFRIPDVMRQSGARLVEVGTTNRTYVQDYADALHPVNTALLLRVHHSNFSITGFVHEPELAELVSLGEEYAVPVMDDLGSGTLLPTDAYGLAHEPTIQESIAAGAAIVTASGDKLLGGPQAGLVLGRRELIARLRRHPLTRAVRVDKTTLAALQATLLAYLENRATEEIPVWRMISAGTDQLRRRARKWQRALNNQGIASQVVMAQSTVGGGSLPGQSLPTYALSIDMPSVHHLATRLRLPAQAQAVPVVARIDESRLLFDPRTVLPEQDTTLVEMIRQAVTVTQQEMDAAG